MRFIKKNLGIISLALFFVNCLIVGFLLGRMGAFERAEGESVLIVIAKLALMLVGAYLSLSLHIIAHELGHLIGGIKGKYAFLSFAVGPLNFEKEGEKVVLKWKSFKGIGGLCRMIPNKDSAPSDFARHIRGGLIGSAIATAAFLIIFAICYIFASIAAFHWLAVFFALSYPLSLFILLNNAAVVKVNNTMTDGAYLEAIKNKDNSGLAILAVVNYQSVVASGVRPRDVQRELIDAIPVLPDNDGLAPVVISNLFSYYVDVGDMEKVAYATRKLEDVIPHSSEVYVDDLKTDLLLGYCLIGELEKADALYGELADKDDYSALRSCAYYNALVAKDEEKAIEYADRARKKLGEIPILGGIESEKELLDRLNNQ